MAPRPINFWQCMTDEDRLTEGPPVAKAARLERIIAAATSHLPGVEVRSAARCERAGVSGGCEGRLGVRWEDSWPPIVHWRCMRCGDAGSVWGWDETTVDRRSRGVPIGVPRDGEQIVSLSFADYDVLGDEMAYCEDAAPGRIQSGAVVDPSSPGRVVVPCTADELDEALDYVCYWLAEHRGTDTGHGLARVWHELDAALAASGREARHERREERIRGYMHRWSRCEGVVEPYKFPEYVDGYMEVLPERARILAGELAALREAIGRDLFRLREGN